MKSIRIKKRGFTLIEILVVIGLIAILAAIVLIAINPSRQFAQARNSQRVSNVEAILNAVGQNLADNKGVFTCAGVAYAISATAVDIKNGATNGDVANCLVPTYMASMPIDPVGTTTAPTCTPTYVSSASYDTCYTIQKDATSGRITVAAPDAELGQTISITR